MDKPTSTTTWRRARTGWLILDIHSLQPIEFYLEEDGPDEAPYSNDNGILQFHLSIDFSGDYPTAKIIE